MTASLRLALIDDNDAILDALVLYFARKNVLVSCFNSAEAFLEATGANEIVIDCIVSDVRMPGMSGLELVRHLSSKSKRVPIVLMTGHGDIAMAVEAIKAGAFNFLEKPFDERVLLEVIESAVQSMPEPKEQTLEDAEMRQQIALLPPRQRAVLKLAAAGMSNKEIALQLNISPRTVENHRAWLMRRLGARNVVDLVHISMLGDENEARSAP